MSTGLYLVSGLSKDRFRWVSTKEKTGRGLVSRLANLRVVCIHEWLHKFIPVVFMFGLVVSKED